MVLPRSLSRNTILWSPANTGPILVRNQALTIHDLSPLEHPEWFKPAFALWYRFFLPTLARRVRVVFSPSEFVKEKVGERFGIENVIVTPNGVDMSIFHSAARQTAFQVPDKYILFVGSIQPRKNLNGLMRAWRGIKEIHKDTWLVIAGGMGNIFARETILKEERVRFLGYVSDTVLPGLYASSELFILPSFDEGSGLPALEAMACGTPVVVSNGGALPEVVGDAGLIFDLSQPDSLAEMMRICLKNNDLRAALIKKGLAHANNYSWQTTADLIWKTLNEI
jgi:glycosyltransferase involved in cell wall biosynthesis